MDAVQTPFIFIDGASPYGNPEEEFDEFSDAMGYSSGSDAGWNEVTSMNNGMTSFMGSDGLESWESGGGSTPYESIMRDSLLSQLPDNQTVDAAPQTGCTGNNVGYVDANGTLNVCIYSSPTRPTVQAGAATPESSSLGAGDAIGSGLASYSTWTSQMLESNGVKTVSSFGIRYGLPDLLADLPGAVGGAIGLGETYVAYENGNNREALESGVGTIFSIGGAEAGAEAGAMLGAVFPPAELIAPVVGALIGGIGGAIVGHRLGDAAYRHVAPPANIQTQVPSRR